MQLWLQPLLGLSKALLLDYRLLWLSHVFAPTSEAPTGGSTPTFFLVPLCLQVGVIREALAQRVQPDVAAAVTKAVDVRSRGNP